MTNHQIKKIDRYQNRSVAITQNMVKFKAEIADIHKVIPHEPHFDLRGLSEFESEYQSSLLLDLTSTRGQEDTLTFLKRYKSEVMQITRYLRSARLTTRKQIAALEDRETEILHRL